MFLSNRVLDKGYLTHCTGAVRFIFQGLRSNLGFLMYPRIFSAKGKTLYPRLFSAEGSFPYPRLFIADILCNAPRSVYPGSRPSHCNSIPVLRYITRPTSPGSILHFHAVYYNITMISSKVQSTIIIIIKHSRYGNKSSHPSCHSLTLCP